MAYLPTLTVVTVLHLVTVASGYGTGAPLSACTTMVPGHSGVSQQTSAAPFTLTVSKAQYTAGETVTVTITATGAAPLAAFLLQARLADPSLNQNEPQGVFTAIPNTQTVNCASKTGSALTHTNGLVNTFNPLVVEWTAPTPAPGHIKFRATVATQKSTYWVNVMSPMVMSPTAPVIVTTPASVQPSITDVSAIDMSGCGKTKGCLRSPEGCSFASCEAVLTWHGENSSDYVNFEISRQGTGWVAVGLSSDKSMGDDSVMACLRGDGGKMVVSQSKNEGSTNMPIASPKDEGIDQIKIGYANDIMICRFRRKKRVDGRTSEIFDISSSYYLILAKGKTITSGSSIGITKHEKTPFITSEKMSFSENTDSSISSNIRTAVKAHGSIMILAWVVMASFGITMARHYKKQWPGKKIFGKDVWFPLHQMAMGSTFLLSITAAIIIFVDVGKFSVITSGPSILAAHPVLGVIVNSLALLNPIMAAFRPAPNATRRPLFNWAHWGVGTLARILAVVTIFLGLSLLQIDAGKSVNPVYVMIGFVCFYVLCEISLELHRCMNKPKASDENEMELKGSGGTNSGITYQHSTSGQLFRSVVLGFLILGLLGFGIALIAIIASS